MRFLNLYPKSFGLDISELSLKIAMLKNRKEGLSLVSYGLEKIKPGIIQEGEIKDSKALAETIKKAVEKVNGQPIRTKYVAFSLLEAKSFLEVIQLPKMKSGELESAVRFEAENYIPLPLERVYLGFKEIKPLYGKIDHADVLIASLPKKTVDPYVSCLKEAGFQPSILEIESQAISQALIKNEVSERPVLIIDFGETRTSFIIWAGCCVRFTSTIPVSSQGFTEAIAKNLGIKRSEAEKLKVKYGLKSKGEKGKKISKEVFNALIPLMTDLVEQIKNCLDYYLTHANHEHLPPAPSGRGSSAQKGGRPVGDGIEKIILCGGGITLRGLSGFLASQLKLPVSLADPWINLGALKKKPLSNNELLAYSTALGLAIQGAK